MNTISGIGLALLIGVIIWGVARNLYQFPVWGLRGFWVGAVCGILIGAKLPDPFDKAVMSIFTGMIIFEHLYLRHLQNRARRAAAAATPSDATPEKRAERKEKN